MLAFLVAAALVAARSAAAAALVGSAGWEQSFRAGYTDAGGKYAGGSEIVHLVPHKGRLFAGVSYWEDQRYLEGRAGAQVIRLDSPNAAWQVDLDCSAQHMKLNILKSVTFSQDGAGRPLAKPVNLLLAAEGKSAGPGRDAYGISVFVRDDEAGTWTETTAIEGSTRQGRWIPRAVEVYIDSVTGVERVFLCLGNPGVLAGVYDPTQPGKIRWDAVPEVTGLATRPLAMTVAGGRLFFSAGSRVYRREDGSNLSWSVFLDMNESLVNPDSGGLRGLTAIPTPGVHSASAGKQSLLFMWAPDGHSRGCVFRVDDLGGGSRGSSGPKLQREICAADLMEEALKTRVGYALGAYNRMFSVVHPVSHEQVYLIGMEARLPDAPAELKWNAYYAGAMFAVRAAEGKTYSVGWVNGSYRPGSPPLEAVRAWALSPFDGERGAGSVLYAGGFDANFYLATDRAWILRADLSMVLNATAMPLASDRAARGSSVSHATSLDVGGGIYV